MVSQDLLHGCVFKRAAVLPEARQLRAISGNWKQLRAQWAARRRRGGRRKRSLVASCGATSARAYAAAAGRLGHDEGPYARWSLEELEVAIIVREDGFQPPRSGSPFRICTGTTS